MKLQYEKAFYRIFICCITFSSFVINYFLLFINKRAVGTYGVNRTINFSGIDIDAVLRNPIYNSSAFIFTYPIYILSYFIIFLIRRFTEFIYSILSFSILIINYILLCINPENRILIPLTIIGLIIFILNIFKTTKNPTTNNKQPSTIK